VPRKIIGMSINKLNPTPVARSPAVNKRLSPGKAKKIPDSRKTIIKIPM